MKWDEIIELTPEGEAADITVAPPSVQEMMLALRELCTLKGVNQVTKRELFNFMLAKKANWAGGFY